MPEDMPEDMPDHMPEDMPDRMSNRMSEDMSDRMPEDLPVRKCINVMVGITRSKVIFILLMAGFCNLYIVKLAFAGSGVPGSSSCETFTTSSCRKETQEKMHPHIIYIYISSLISCSSG